MVRKLFAIVPIVLFVSLAIIPGAIAHGTLYNDSLLLTTTTDKPLYRSGERVEMTLLVEQIQGIETYKFMSTQRFDFELYSHGTLIWRWSDDKVFGLAIGYETLWPGDPSRSYTVTWDSTGTAPGIYDLKGIWTCVEPIDHPFDWVQFEIGL